MSDIEFRVDEAFSSAVQQQIDEQRQIKKLVSRVDETLIALSDGLGDLSGHLDMTVEQLTGASPADVEQARADIVEHISRVTAALEEAMGSQASSAGLDALGERVSSLSTEVLGARSDLLDALDRLRQDDPTAELVERARQDLIERLEMLPEALRAREDMVWETAVERLDEVIDRATRTANVVDSDHRADRDADRAAVAEMVQAWQAEAENALQRLGDARSERDSSVVNAIRQLHDEVASAATRGEAADNLLFERVMTATGDLATEVVHRHDDILARLQQVVAIADKVAPDTREGLDHIAGRLADMVQRSHDDAMQAVEAAGAARGATPEEVRGIVAGLLDHMDARVNSSLADVLDRNATAADAVTRAADVLQRRAEATSGQLDEIAQRIVGRIDEAGGRQADLVEGQVERAVASLLEQQTSTSRAVREAADSLLAAAGGLEPQMVEAVDTLREALLEQTGADRAEVDAAFTTLKEASDGARDGVVDAVSRATARLAEVQGEGISRLSSVAEQIGRLPETVSPAVLVAVEEMRAGVAEALQALHLQTQEASTRAAEVIEAAVVKARERLDADTAEAGQQAISWWQRLAEVQQDQAERMERATAALGVLAEELEPSVRTAMGDTSAALRQHIDGAATTMQEAALDAGSRLRQDAEDLGAGLRRSADEAAETVREAATRAAGDVASGHEEALAALDTATGRVHETSLEVAKVAGSTRSELLEAVREAKAEVAELLSRTDDATREAITASVAEASEHWLREVSTQGVALAARTEEILRATGGITPAVDDLVARLKDEVAAVAGEVLADVQGSVGETNRLVQALEPTLQQLVVELRESMAAEVLEARSAASRETERITRAAEVVEQQTAEQVTRLAGAADTLTSATAEVQPQIDRGLEQLRSAVNGAASLVDARLSTIAETTDSQLKSSMQAVAGHEAAIAESGQALRTDLEANLARTRQALEEGIGALVDGLTDTMEAQLGALQASLGEAATQTSSTSEQVVGAADSVRGVIAEVQQALEADIRRQTDDIASRLSESVAGLIDQFGALSQQTVADVTATSQQTISMNVAANERFLDEVKGHLETVGTRLDRAVEQATSVAARADEATAKASHAAAQADSTSQDLVGIGAQVVSSVEMAVAEFDGRMNSADVSLKEALSREVSGMVAQVRSQVDDAVTGATAALEQQAAALQERIAGMEGVEAEVADRLDGLVTEVAGRLTGELVMTRDTIRTAAATEAGIAEDHIARVLAGIEAIEQQVETAVLRAVSEATGARAQTQREELEQVLRAAVTDAVGDAAARDHDAEQRGMAQAVQRLEALGTQIGEQDERRAIDLKRLQSALTDMHGEMRADGDALLDAVASRVDQMVGQMSTVPAPPSTGSAEDALAHTAALLQDAVAQLQAVGAQMEKQVQRVERLDVRIDETLRRETAEMAQLRRGTSEVVAGGHTGTARTVPSPAAPSSRAPGASQQPPRSGSSGMPPPTAKRGEDVIVTTAGSTTCPDCGFVTRTRQGMVAHRKTCDARA